MAMTKYDATNYNFHENTLSDRQVLVTNSTARTLLHFELAYIAGFFGEICEFADILTTASGRLNINNERTMRSSQVKPLLADNAFVLGATVYFIPQTDISEGLLTSVYEATAIPVGTITAFDVASEWVEFRPFVQNVELSLASDARGIAVNPMKLVQLTVPIGSEAGVTFANLATGLAVGDTIVDVSVKATVSSVAGTMLTSHGAGGASITNAIICAVANAVTRAGSVVGGVVTADGLTVTPNATGDAGIVTIMYIPA